MNVLTAYSADEAIQTFSRFPSVDGIVLDIQVSGLSCPELISELRALRDDVPIITVSPTGYDRCGGEQYHVSGHDPQQLLEVLKQVCSKAPPPGTLEAQL